MNKNLKATEMNSPDRNNTESIPQSVFWGTIALNGITLLVYAYIFSLFLQQAKTVGIYFAIAVTFLSILAAIAGIVLTIRQRQDLGLKLSLYPIFAVTILIVSIFQGRTLPASFSVLMISIVANIWLLQRQSRRRHLIVTILAFVAMWVIEWIDPSWRITINAVSVGPVGAGIFLAIFIIAVGTQIWRGNLRNKLVFAFLVVTLIPLGIVSFLNYQNTTKALVDAANVKIAGAAQVTADQVDAFIINTLNATRVKAQDPAIVDYLLLPSDQRSGSPEETQVYKLLTAYSREDPLYVNSIGVIDANGKSLVDTSQAEIGLDKSTRIYFQQPMKTGLPYSSELIFSEVTGKPSLYFTAPVYDLTDGSILGVLRIRYDAGILQSIVSQNAGLAGTDSLPVLLDENHIRLAHGVLPELDYKTIVPLSSDVLASLQAEHRLPSGTAEELATNLPEFEAGLNNVDKQPFFLAELHEEGQGTEETTAVKLKSHSWIMVFGQTETVFLAPIQTQTRNSLIVVVVLAVIVAFFGLYVAQSLAGPVVRLTSVANQIASGDIQVEAKVETGDEIGTLARTFNTMTSQLRDFINTLEQRVAQRTKALATSTEVSRRLSTILDEKQLLVEVVEQIKAAYNYYHGQIYLLDETGQTLVLAGATGEGGQALLNKGHKLSIDRGLVGRAARSKSAVLVPDTSKEPEWVANSLLPDTKAEIAIPILLGDEVLGVIDMQDNVVGDVYQEDVEFLQAIANQVAIALQNSRSYAQAQRRAEREALISSINQKIQNESTVESALQVAIREVGRALGTSARVKLKPSNGQE